LWIFCRSYIFIWSWPFLERDSTHLSFLFSLHIIPLLSKFKNLSFHISLISYFFILFSSLFWWQNHTNFLISNKKKNSNINFINIFTFSNWTTTKKKIKKKNYIYLRITKTRHSFKNMTSDHASLSLLLNLVFMIKNKYNPRKVLFILINTDRYLPHEMILFPFQLILLPVLFLK
jgi:hypothetical protein